MKAWLIHTDGNVQPYRPFVNPESKALTKEDHLRLFKTLGIKDGGCTERVSVLFDGQICDMIVDESGAVNGLPINARASLIYWTATCQGKTGAAYVPLVGPLVHGRAVLYEGRVWT
jgi:hypothetical protein